MLLEDQQECVFPAQWLTPLFCHKVSCKNIFLHLGCRTKQADVRAAPSVLEGERRLGVSCCGVTTEFRFLHNYSVWGTKSGQRAPGRVYAPFQGRNFNSQDSYQFDNLFGFVIHSSFSLVCPWKATLERFNICWHCRFLTREHCSF